MQTMTEQAGNERPNRIMERAHAHLSLLKTATLYAMRPLAFFV
jgi:hypothetical protein